MFSTLSKLFLSQSVRSLIGTILIHFGLGTIATWGNVNLYVLSYFHHLGYNITPSTNSIIMLITIIPMSISMLLTTSLMKKLSSAYIIKIGSIFYMISPLFGLINNLYAFIFGILILPACMFSIVTVPTLSCIWTQFPESKSKVTAVTAIALGLGTAMWNSIFTHSINPDNQTIVDNKTDSQMNFFRKQVTQNLIEVAVICFAISGFISLIGSVLVKPRQNIDQNFQQQVYQGHHNEKQQKQLQIKENRNQIISSYSSQPQFNSLSDVFKDLSFILITIFILIACLFEIQLVLSLKIVYQPIINDDHFLTYCVIILTIVGVSSAYGWGVICDKKGIGFCMLLLAILDTILKIFSLFTDSKFTLVVLMVLIGLQTKSLGTFVAPGWAQLYGLKIGTQLIPYKAIAFLLGFILAPLIQVITSSFLTQSQYLTFLALTCIITTPVAIKFYLLTRHKHRSFRKSQTEQQLT